MPPRPARRPRTARATTVAMGAAGFAALVAGCGLDEGGSTDAEVTAVATTTHVADLARNVGGDRVDVHQFLTPGVDPHDYEPRPSDAQAVADADVVLRSGGDLDGWLAGLLDDAGDDTEIVTVLDTVESVEGGPAPEGDEHAEEGEVEDPHWWQDPRNAIVGVEAIADALAEADPGGADTYRRNAERYIDTLETLDQEISRCMGEIPDDRRRLVTTHDAYGYFAERYDVEVIGALIPSRSTQAQPSAGDTTALVDQIESQRVEVIFPESPLNPELEEAVAEEAGATVGDPLWADSLGPAGSGGETYVDALASDAETLAEGFTGQPGACRIEA